MKTVTVSRKNQIVIPAAVRAKLKVKSGDKLIVARVTDTEVVLRKEPSYDDFMGMLPTQDEDPVTRIRKIRENWRNNKDTD